MMREVVTVDGVKRFKANDIVRDLLDGRVRDLNEIWMQEYSADELKEFYQLIGYSLFGYWEIFEFNNDEKNSRGWSEEDQALMEEHGVLG